MYIPSIKRIVYFSIVAAAVVGIHTRSASAVDLSSAITGSGISVSVDGELFTEYRINSGMKPILWPLVGPTGKEMTRAYPMRKGVEGEKADHPHHRSLWFTHGDVNGIDFWTESAKKEKQGRIVHRDFGNLSVGGDAVSFVANSDWMGPDGKKICEDSQRIVISADEDHRTIDCTITVRASEGEVKFGDTKEGSFGVRVAGTMKVESKLGGKIINSEGQTDGKAWGKPAAWVDYHGPVDGETVGVAILNHPESFRYPTHWHVRTYGLFAANPFGLHDFTGDKKTDGSHTLAKGESFTLRYRVILHKGDEKVGKIAEAFAEYAKEKAADK